MPQADTTLLRKIPSVEVLLQDEAFGRWRGILARRVVVNAVRSAVEDARAGILGGRLRPADARDLRARIVSAASNMLLAASRPRYRRVINATGIVLHTALGRAVLPDAALSQLHNEISGYCLLQADPVTGKRSSRDAAVESLLKTLTGAAAAAVVNNNAGATSIVLNTVAKGREVIVSRGQLVEIGGSFRLPDVMEASGVRLVEVGTTNKTHARDYENAVTENTAAILRVHPSNYKIIGFSSEVQLSELVRIAHARGLTLIDDVGAGSLVDLSKFGFSYEPTLPDSIRGGADVVTSSGDKLIGSAQAGIILGKSSIVSAIRKSPLARILRVDKLTLACLEATLTLFLDEPRALAEVPTLRMLLRGLDDIATQAARIADLLCAAAPALAVEAIDGFSQVGSGSLPGQDLPTRLVALRGRSLGAERLALRLRTGDPPVFARIHDDRVLLDPRTLQEGEEDALVRAVAAALETPAALDDPAGDETFAQEAS